MDCAKEGEAIGPENSVEVVMIKCRLVSFNLLP